MQKKTKYLAIGIVVVALLLVGGYALFHKSPTTSTPTTASSSTTPSNSDQSSSTDTSAAVIQTKTASNVGSYLATSSDYALYTYGADTAGVSNCTGSCLSAWPAYAPTSSSATLPTNVTIITRSDGTKQYAYKQMPLYTFTSDPVGQVTGNGVSNFSVAKP